MLEQILSQDNMERAFKRVTANKGAAGVDGVDTTELGEVLAEQWPRIKRQILEGSYTPEPVRRVEIDKPGGGVRPLGIPTTTDRLIQQAIGQVLGPIYEPVFSEYSYGFRPGRSAHDGVQQALSYINQGYDWVVEVDLKSFFDKVNHDYLMHLVSQRIGNKPLLKLIRRYLQSGVMEGGVVSPSRQGTPQGGPLSPLLSNILLDELDKELERRGHRFVRYADDCSVYVGSRRAGERVLASLTRFIEEELHLKVNRRKSGVRKASEMKLLGYGFYRSKDGWRLRVASKSLIRFKAKLREVTRKTWPVSMDERLERLSEVSRGWVNYFKFADARSHLRRMDGWVRSRLRYCIWTQWKRVRTRYKALRKLGASHRNAYIWANTRKGGWHTAHSYVLTGTITNARLRQKGYKSLFEFYGDGS
jgi:group II intron reverse transcriptase/maturase